MRKLLVSIVSIGVFAIGAPTASAHFIIVTPPGNGEGTSHHVGQFPPGHNSCFGLSTADSKERSQAVDFLGPPAALCPP